MREIFVPSTWKRLMACGMDQFFMMFFYLPFVGYVWKVFTRDEDVFIPLLMLCLLFMIPAIYEFIFLVIWQATPGKLMMGLRVVPSHDSDHKLELSQCIIRPLVGRLSLFFSWAIYALAFFKYDRTHLADWFAETRVVQFLPRLARPKIRWILGLILLISYSYEGLVYSSTVFKNIDWENKRANFRVVIDSGDMSSIKFDDDYDDEE